MSGAVAVAVPTLAYWGAPRSRAASGLFVWTGSLCRFTVCAIKPEPRPSRTVKKPTPNPNTGSAGTVVFSCSHERCRGAVGLSSLGFVGCSGCRWSGFLHSHPPSFLLTFQTRSRAGAERTGAWDPRTLRNRIWAGGLTEFQRNDGELDGEKTSPSSGGKDRLSWTSCGNFTTAEGEREFRSYYNLGDPRWAREGSGRCSYGLFFSTDLRLKGSRGGWEGAGPGRSVYESGVFRGLRKGKFLTHTKLNISHLTHSSDSTPWLGSVDLSAVLPCIGLYKCMYVCMWESEWVYVWMCMWVCVRVCVLAPHTLSHTLTSNYRAAFTSITRTEAEAPNPVRTRRVHQRLSPSRVAEDWATVGRTQACVFRVVNTAANLARSAVHMRGFGGVRLGAPCFPATGLIYSFHMRKCKLAGVLMGVSMHTHTHTDRQTLSHTHGPASEPNPSHLSHHPTGVRQEPVGRTERGFQFPQELLECCFCFETVLPSVSLSYSVSLSDQLQHMCSMFTGASLLRCTQTCGSVLTRKRVFWRIVCLCCWLHKADFWQCF